MEIKFYKCTKCGRDDIILPSDFHSPYCQFCGEESITEIDRHTVWHSPWLYLSKEYSVKDRKFDTLYLWSGILIKWPVVILEKNWVGNLAGTLLGVDLPNGHCYKIFNRAIHQYMVNRGYWKTIPSWTR